MASLPFLTPSFPFFPAISCPVGFGGVGVGEDLHLWLQLIRSGWALIRVWLPF